MAELLESQEQVALTTDGDPAILNGVPVVEYTNSRTSTRIPLATRPPGETGLAPAAESLAPLFQRMAALPKTDKSGPIQWEPAAEEQQAFENLLQSFSRSLGAKELETLARAFLLASYAHRLQVRESGDPYIYHPIAVTRILAELNMDSDTLLAGLLHDVAEDTEFPIDYIRELFGSTVAMLVDGVTKLKRINELSNAQQGISNTKAESLRKMFLAMVEDIRVVIIKLADRLHNMRTLGTQKEHKRRRIARETLDIFAPLANRLGMWRIKSELEDLSFRWLDPNSYKDLAKAMQQKQVEREKLIIRVKAELERALAEAGIPAVVTGRPKHIYSIWRKMRRKEVDFEQIYDIHGFRVIVETEQQCYAALGVVHSLWRPIPGEFDDYIANPKNNMYRSLHTAVLNKRDGRPMEVQIRTQEMHRIAEYGIAAHWQYKEANRYDAEFQNKINWLRQLMEWRQEVTDPDEFIDSMRTDVFKDWVFIFTPQGDIVELPAGSTPIDFAYSIHTELGHRCRGANVNGRLVPLDYKLKNGDQVTIISAKRGGPSRDWLNPALEYTATQRARSKIRTWLRKQGREENIQRGREMLEKELDRLSATLTPEILAKLFNYEKVDDLLAAIGYGDVNSQQIAQRVLDHERREQARLAAYQTVFTSTSPGERRRATEGLVVQGVPGLLTQLGRCCHPVPGDAIVGYVTKGRGVTIHRTDCPNIKTAVSKNHGSRLVDVQWVTKPDATYPVKIEISAYDRAGLVADVAGLVANEHVNMRHVEALTGQKNNLALINAELEITDVAQLMRILTKIDRLPNIVNVRRKMN
ncbi:MAG: (p)ppGpp synthetase [Chloroflexi bacterium]|nr:MAG: (p)ppGpp synthetase [Chloroflexota bacterium]